MHTQNAPLRPRESRLSRPALSEVAGGGAHPVLSEWDLLSREMMVMLQDSASRRNDQIERWQKLSRAISDFIETMKQTTESRADAYDRKAAAKLERLTTRQRQIMKLVVQGRANKVIAYLLNISVRTVENHRATIMKKTGVRTLPDLVRIAMTLNIPPDNAEAP